MIYKKIFLKIMEKVYVKHVESMILKNIEIMTEKVESAEKLIYETNKCVMG